MEKIKDQPGQIWTRMKSELPNGSENWIRSPENASTHGSVGSQKFEMEPWWDMAMRKAKVLNIDLILVP